MLIYDNVEVKDEVEGPVCNMTQEHLRILLDTIVEHANFTAVRELYFPDGFDPQLILKLYTNLQELGRMPTVEVSAEKRI